MYDILNRTWCTDEPSGNSVAVQLTACQFRRRGLSEGMLTPVRLAHFSGTT